ncbi:MAG: hypothetical protein DHS20C08_01940 [Rhodomicrobium sp.]|nr:MAG: hypothetical protein DHS20C08_01940 [Rhodomicrobium sp.]
MFNLFHLLTLLFDNSKELSVRHRILEASDRSIAIANISSISLSRFPLWPLLVFLLLPGVLTFLSALFTMFGFMAFSGFNSNQIGGMVLASLPTLLFAGGLIGLFFFLKKRRKSYLVITSNDGSTTVFSSGDLSFLQGVKDAIDDKINNDKIDTTFYANFAEGAVQNLSVGQFEAETVNADTVLANSPGSMVANHSPGAQLGNGHTMQDAVFTTDYRPAAERVDENGEKPWYEKMLDVPLEKTSDFLAGLKGDGPGPAEPSEISTPRGRATEGPGFTPSPPERGAFGAPFPPDHRVQADHGEPNMKPENVRKTSHHMPPSGEYGGMNGHMNGPLTAQHSPGAQLGQFNQMNGAMIITDYSQHIPNVERIRQELTDPKVTEKLDEMLALMKAGTPQPEDKRRLRDYAMELATIVQAYPPITKIFNDIIHVIGA